MNTHDSENKKHILNMTDPERMLSAIRDRAAEIGITQTEIAQRCGWTQPLASAYLSGSKSPGLVNLAKLARAVGCEWVLTESR
jgi:transcriptional regulator with XRE-family HTH domain